MHFCAIINLEGLIFRFFNMKTRMITKALLLTLPVTCMQYGHASSQVQNQNRNNYNYYGDDFSDGYVSSNINNFIGNSNNQNNMQTSQANELNNQFNLNKENLGKGSEYNNFNQDSFQNTSNNVQDTPHDNYDDLLKESNLQFNFDYSKYYSKYLQADDDSRETPNDNDNNINTINEKKESNDFDLFQEPDKEFLYKIKNYEQINQYNEKSEKKQDDINDDINNLKQNLQKNDAKKYIQLSGATDILQNYKKTLDEVAGRQALELALKTKFNEKNILPDLDDAELDLIVNSLAKLLYSKDILIAKIQKDLNHPNPIDNYNYWHRLILQTLICDHITNHSVLKEIDEKIQPSGTRDILKTISEYYKKCDGIKDSKDSQEIYKNIDIAKNALAQVSDEIIKLVDELQQTKNGKFDFKRLFSEDLGIISTDEKDGNWESEIALDNGNKLISMQTKDAKGSEIIKNGLFDPNEKTFFPFFQPPQIANAERIRAFLEQSSKKVPLGLTTQNIQESYPVSKEQNLPVIDDSVLKFYNAVNSVLSMIEHSSTYWTLICDMCNVITEDNLADSDYEPISLMCSLGRLPQKKPQDVAHVIKNIKENWKLEIKQDDSNLVEVVCSSILSKIRDIALKLGCSIDNVSCTKSSENDLNQEFILKLNSESDWLSMQDAVNSDNSIQLGQVLFCSMPIWNEQNKTNKFSFPSFLELQGKTYVLTGYCYADDHFTDSDKQEKQQVVRPHSLDALEIEESVALDDDENSRNEGIFAMYERADALGFEEVNDKVYNGLRSKVESDMQGNAGLF